MELSAINPRTSFILQIEARRARAVGERRAVGGRDVAGRAAQNAGAGEARGRRGNCVNYDRYTLAINRRLDKAGFTST